VAERAAVRERPRTAPGAHRRSTEPPRPSGVRPLFTIWGAWLVLMAGANLATPLYAVYAQRFGFSSLVLTAIFSAYAVVLVPALVIFGRLVTGCVGLALFAAAQGTPWLFAARAVQGLAVGMISGAATAALVELDPQRGGRRPALLAGLAQAGGSAIGPLLAGVLAQWAPAPRQLVFCVALALTAVAAALVLTLPQARPEEREPWRPQLPRVPRAIRRDFARVSLTAAVGWGTLALCLSIVPSYARDLLRTRDLALLGAVAALALASSCVAQVVSQRRRTDRRRTQAVGLALLAIGLVALTGAAPLHSLTVLVGAAVAAGAGQGLGFVAAQDELNELAPDERRGEVTAAFITCIYLVVASAVIATGILDREAALTVAVGAVAVVLAALALVAATWQARFSFR
jgi:MFS family permease